jgi:peroxiredoxin
MSGFVYGIRTTTAALLIAGVCGLLARAQAPTAPAGTTPAVGQQAPDFTLAGLDGSTVRLSDQTARGPVVLVVLRGWPGYQCPFCTRQFGDYLSHGPALDATGARVVFVYPGPADDLKAHAQALTADRPLPASFRIVIDPDYTFTRAYALRWDAPQETAYPSTFVLDRRGTVMFVRTSHVHGDRVPVADVLAALAALDKK